MMTHHRRKKMNPVLGLAIAIACSAGLWYLAWAVVETTLKIGVAL